MPPAPNHKSRAAAAAKTRRGGVRLARCHRRFPAVKIPHPQSPMRSVSSSPSLRSVAVGFCKEGMRARLGLVLLGGTERRQQRSRATPLDKSKKMG